MITDHDRRAEFDASPGRGSVPRSFNLLPMQRLWYGERAVENLPAEIEKLGGKRVFLITSRTIASSTDLVPRFEKLLGPRLIGIAHSREHVPRAVVLETADRARDTGADLLLTLGGGSQIDCGKAVALCLAEGVSAVGDLDRYRVIYKSDSEVVRPSLKGGALPHVSISTTLSAAEFTNIAGITDEHRLVKDLYIDDQLVPQVAFLDPLLTVDTPGWLWACTGMRAVDHCVEGYLSSDHTPFTDALIAHALRTLIAVLPRSAREPENTSLRAQCQLAAWMSIFGLTNVMLGLSHGIGHQLGARCGVPHGITSCLMLSHVMAFNLPVVRGRLAELAEIMGVDTTTLSTKAAAEAAVSQISDLVQRLGLPSRLRDVNVRKRDFEGIVRDAMDDAIVAGNPRRPTAKDIYDLLHQAY